MIDRNITVFTSSWPPYLFTSGEPNDLKVDGPLAFLLQNFANNLNYSLHLADENGDWGECDKNKECNKYLSVIKMKKADLSIYPVIMNTDEFEYGKFTNPIAVTDLTVLVGIPPDKTRMFAFFTTVDLQVWILLFITLKAMLFCIVYFEFVERHHTPPTYPNIWGQYVWHLAAILLTGASKLAKSSNPFRMVSVFWMLGRFHFVSIYGGDMTSSFFLISTPDYLSFVDDFLRFPDVTPLIWRNSVEAAFFQNNPDSPYKEVWQRIETGNSFIDGHDVYNTTLLLADKIKTTLFAWICLETDTFYLLRFKDVNDDCHRRNYHLVKPFSNVFLSLMLRKDIPHDFLEHLNRRILRMQQAGVIGNEFYENHRDYNWCLDKKVVPDALALSLNAIYGVFVVWLSGLMVAFIAVVFENLHSVFRRKRKF